MNNPRNWYMEGTAKKVPDSPWLHPAVIGYLEMLITDNMQVLEIGGGGSTFFFARRAAMVTTIEDNPDWVTAIKRRALAEGWTNIILHPGIEPAALPRQYFDFMLIDGGNRIMWMDAVPELVRPGGIVLVDNSNRAQYADGMNRLHLLSCNWTSIRGNVPGSMKPVEAVFFRIKGGKEAWI